MILMNDFKAEPVEIRDAMALAARRVIDSGWYVLGKEVECFEAQWSAACGVRHGVGVGNGMDAIEIALRAFDIGIGDEVITTPMTAFATVLAVLRAGATPILADIDLDTGLMSLESAKRCVTKNTKVILLVHLYGQVRDMNKWIEFCDSEKIKLIEDCAQSHLAKWQGKFAGSFGRAGAYSFYPTKNLGALGDAGMIVTDDQVIADNAKRLRNYGQSIRYHHADLGMNSRLDEMQAAILLERQKWLAEYTERRRVIADLYRHGINNPNVNLLASPQERDSHAYHLFVVTCKQRDSLQNHLMESDIQSLIHYPISIHHQKPCLNIKKDGNGLKNSKLHADSCLSLPCHPQMTDADVQIVINAVNAFKD